jgi:long-chain fatty acid transport protein
MKPITSTKGKLATGVMLAATAGIAVGAGYKLPESSSNATALSAAYIANANGPDASYYNPAGMAMNKDGAAVSGDLTLVHLPRINYQGTVGASPRISDNSLVENILVPTAHYVSPYVGNARFGLSIVTPGGLSKQWRGTGAFFAEEFTLRTVEVNPTVGYRLTDFLAVGAGARMVYSDGDVRRRLAPPAPAGSFLNLTGDSVDFGYNLALHFEPNDSFAFAVTYRSKIDLSVEGDATFNLAGVGQSTSSADVEVPLPATLSLASAFKLRSDTTLEVVFERTYWSDYRQLDFNFTNPAFAAFETPVPKNWKDSNTLRFGLTHQLDDQWTLMGGFALDNSPTPKQTVSFELPESDGTIVSLGARYKASKQWEFAGGVLYTQREKLNLGPADGNLSGLVGTFDKAGAVLVTLGAQYNFM